MAFESSSLTTVQEQQLIKQRYSSEVALLDFAISEPQSLPAEFEGPWSFILLGIMGKDGKILSRLKLKAAAVEESGYEEVSLTMQIAIKALQEVDPLAKRQRVALSRSEHILISVSQTGSAQLGNYSIQRQEVSDDRNPPLLLLGSHSSQKQEVSVDCDSPLLLLGGHSSQKQEVLVESDSPLSSFLLVQKCLTPRRHIEHCGIDYYY